MTIAAAYRKHESTKKREYAQRVRDVEHGVFKLESPRSNKKHTHSSWGGFNAVSPLQSSAPPSYASVGAILSTHPVCEWNIALATSEGRVPSDVH